MDQSQEAKGLTPEQDTTLRAAIEAAFAEIPGYDADAIMEPLVKHLAAMVASQAPVAEPEATALGPVETAVSSSARSGRFTVTSTPAGCPDEDPRGEVSLTDETGRRIAVVRGTTDPTLIADVLARPDDYVADRGAFRVELWILPYWNEGHDRAGQPVETAFVRTAADAAQIMDVLDVAGHQTRHEWTGFEARMAVASSKARMSDPADVVTRWVGWINGTGPAEFIP